MFRETLALATIAFIEHGAHLGKIWSWSITLEHLLQGASPFEMCTFELQASALSIIELIMRNEPELRRISTMCNAKGAIRHSRCTTIEFNFRRRRGGDKMPKFQLSEQESKDFLEILELSTPDTIYTPEKDAENFSLRLSKLYFRLDESRAGASSASSMNASGA